jgi:glycosyltransferase involved in cell wall biosynthesis
MNVLVLSPTLRNTSPGMRFRLEQWIPYLEADGFRFTYVPFEDERLHEVLYQPGHYAAKALHMLRALGRRLQTLSGVGRFDLIYLYREAALIGPALIERLLAWRGVPIVYDFDDPIWIPYTSPRNRFFSRLKFPGKTRAICRRAAAVLVGNRLLEGWAREHSANVHIVPSTIETAAYPAQPETAETGLITLGWTGSHSTLPFLDLIKGVLARLASRHRFRLLVIAHRDDYRIEGAPYEVISRKWRAETEAADLHPIDIGLGPFPDSGWTPWRCHGKVLQYMAAGIPTVASRLGILPDYVRDGEEGFLVSSEAEWEQALSRLIEDAALRRTMGLKARQVIEERYSAKVWAPRVGEILRSVLAGRPREAAPA